MENEQSKPGIVLVVREPFDNYQRGEVIDDADEIDRLIANGSAANCVKVAA